MPFILSSSIADAYGLIQSRSVTMSSTSNAAATPSTIYSFSFQTAATTNYVQSLVIDFCALDPIIGNTCTLPTGFSTSAVTLSTAVPNFPAQQTGLTWAAGSATSVDSNRSVQITSTGTAAGGGLPSGTTFTFALGGIQNPTTTCSGAGFPCTFYARIMDFNTQAGAAAWVTACGTNGNCTTGVQDAGGIALSTVNTVTVTAKVQEQLSFCLGTTAPPADLTAATAQTACSNISGTTVTLGNTQGVLSTSGPYVDVTTQYIVGTNAAHSAVVALQGNTLKSGGVSIPAMGSTQTLDSPTTSQFGLCTYVGTGSNLSFSGSPGETNGAAGAYDNTNCAAANVTQSSTYGSTGGLSGTNIPKFGLNTTATTTAAGDPLAAEAPGSASTGILCMVANVSTTQQAGIYTTTLSMVATGTY